MHKYRAGVVHMVFDAGYYGPVEVDQVVDLGDRERGILHPDGVYSKRIYTRWKKNGACSQSTLLPPEDLSPEARERVRQDVIRIGEELLTKKERVSLSNRQKTF